MPTSFVASQTIVIDAPAAAVWEALVTPDIIKRYLFGTDTVSDWKVGSTIRFRGVWEGTTYEDGGVILRFEPERILEYTYWSSFSKLPNTEENQSIVGYALASEGASIRLTVTQTNCASEESLAHSEKNWGMVLQSIKQIVEG